MSAWNKHPKHAAPARNASREGNGDTQAAGRRSYSTPLHAHPAGHGVRPAIHGGDAGQNDARRVPRNDRPIWGGSRIAAAAFLLIAGLMCLIPSVGMIWAPTDSTTENRELASSPQLFDEQGAFNWNVLPDAGTYFDDHFALRNDLVEANARLRGAIGASATDQVVVGRDGWLYYGGTLPDYLGQSALSDRALQNIAHNLKLAQDYVEAQGATFAFAIAPNKSTLYGQHMPYYYLKSAEPGNAARLKPLLQEQNVNYVDLFALFGDVSGEWYLKGDSHWDNRGALLATNAVLESVGRTGLGLDVEAAIPRDDFVGDLESMQYPASPKPETNWYFAEYNDTAQSLSSNAPSDAARSRASAPAADGKAQESASQAAAPAPADVDRDGLSADSDGQAAVDDPASDELWSFVEGESVTDGFSRTHSDDGSGSLLMFRDSFGNALLPFWAAAYENAAFSKLVPYNLANTSKYAADTVVVERAERHLAYLAQNPPLMKSPQSTVELDAGATDGDAGSVAVNAAVDGPYLKLSGALDPSACDDSTSIYIGVKNADGTLSYYMPFWTSVEREGADETVANDFGFLVYLDAELANREDLQVSVVARTEDAVARHVADLVW